MAGRGANARQNLTKPSRRCERPSPPHSRCDLRDAVEITGDAFEIAGDAVDKLRRHLAELHGMRLMASDGTVVNGLGRDRLFSYREEELEKHEESLAASLARRSNEREETRQLLRRAEAKMLEARGFSQAVSVPLIASDCA